uniref:Xylulose kinase-1 n=1 Tax=Tanacetum cinerariifolium TaxID=118510 RepID=A0A6L2LAS8_TANCI|nr:hypothetical protein [Tanacetum cinerariifolium]
MSTPKFAETHNLVAFLEKPTESEGFEQIIDFLNANPIKYALMVNPMIYTSCINQFWATTKVKTVNEEKQIQALVDKKKVIITKTSVRSALHLEDARGTEGLPTATIFEQLTLMGQGKDFFGKVTPLFKTMMVQPQEDMGEDLKIPIDSQHTSTVTQPSTSSQPQHKQKSKKSKTKITEVPQLSSSTHDVADEHVTTTSNDPLLSVALVDETQERNDQDMFDTSIFDDEEVVAGKKVSTAGEVVTTAGEVVTTAAVKLTSKSKAKWIVIQEPSETPTPTLIELVKGSEKIAEGSEKTAEGSEKTAEGSSKRPRDKLKQEDAKRQRIEEENESAKLKRCLEIIPDNDDDVIIEATPLSSKSSTIVDYNIYKKGRKCFFKIIKADVNAVGYKLQLLEEFMMSEMRSKTYQRRDKD